MVVEGADFVEGEIESLAHGKLFTVEFGVVACYGVGHGIFVGPADFGAKGDRHGVFGERRVLDCYV